MLQRTAAAPHYRGRIDAPGSICPLSRQVVSLVPSVELARGFAPFFRYPHGRILGSQGTLTNMSAAGKVAAGECPAAQPLLSSRDQGS
jgi:hypothetical protein